MLAVLPALPTVKPPKVLPPVLNTKPLLRVTALEKAAPLFSMASVPGPLIAAAALMTLGLVTRKASVPPLMVVAPTVPAAYRLASSKVKVPKPVFVSVLALLLNEVAKLMFWLLVSNLYA